MSTGPHTLAVLQTLEEMRRRYAEMEPPAREADRHSRAITLALHEVVMPLLAAERDAGTAAGSTGDDEFAQGATHALGNLLCSLASCFVPADTPEARVRTAHVNLAKLLGDVTAHRAMLRAMDPTRGKVVWYSEPAPAEPPT